MPSNVQSMFFEGWTGPLHTLVVGALAYAALVAMLRVSGKRALAKLNAFDFVVTVALGSTLATALMSKDAGLVQVITAFFVLIGLQFAVTWTSLRSEGFRKAIRSEPTLVARDGELIESALRRERLTEEAVTKAIRQSGGRQLKDTQAVFLESDGTLTAILKAKP